MPHHDSHNSSVLFLNSNTAWCAECGTHLQIHDGVAHRPGEVWDHEVSESVDGVISLYLAHPYAEREFGKKVQVALEEAGFQVVNPFERPRQDEYIAAMAAGGLSDEQCASLVNDDIDALVGSMGTVAIITGAPSIDTYMEIMFSRSVMGRKVFALVTDEFARNHPWIRRLTQQYSTVPDLINALKEAANGTAPA